MKNEKGFSLLEVMLAIALLGIIAVAFLGAMATGSRALFIADERATAESLARSQMEYVKSCKYADLPTSMPWSYELPSGHPSWDPSHALPAGYDGYSVTVTGNIIDANGDDTPDSDIQKITVVVYHLEKPVPIVTLEDYKVDR